MSHTSVIRSLRTLMLCVHILNSFRKEGGLKYFYVRFIAEKKKTWRRFENPRLTSWWSTKVVAVAFESYNLSECGVLKITTQYDTEPRID